jgi:hypothetical protein
MAQPASAQARVEQAKRASGALLGEKRIFAWPFNVLMQSSSSENTVRKQFFFGNGIKSG